MKFIYKEDDVFTLDYLINSLFDPLFKISSVSGTSHHAGQVKCNNSFVPHNLWNITGSNQLGKPLNNCSFTNTRFSYQTWVVLCPSAEYLHYSLDFFLTTNYRVKLLSPGHFGKVFTKFQNRQVLLPSCVIANSIHVRHAAYILSGHHLLTRKDHVEVHKEFLRFNTNFHKYSYSYTVGFRYEGNQKMLCANKVLAPRGCFPETVIYDPFCSWCISGLFYGNFLAHVVSSQSVKKRFNFLRCYIMFGKKLS